MCKTIEFRENKCFSTSVSDFLLNAYKDYLGDNKTKVFEVFLFLPDAFLSSRAKILRLEEIYKITVYGSDVKPMWNSYVKQGKTFKIMYSYTTPLPKGGFSTV